MAYKKLLTKSKFMTGLNCLHSLWIDVNDKSSVPPIDDSLQFIFDQGYEVEKIAKSLFPKGIDVPFDNFSDNLRLSAESLSKRVPLFECGFKFERCYSRCDILVPSANKGFDIVEVKSSTKVKPDHINDLAFQLYCYKGGGIKINKIYLMHVNNEYVKNGDIDASEFMIKEDVTVDVLARLCDIDGLVK